MKTKSPWGNSAAVLHHSILCQRHMPEAAAWNWTHHPSDTRSSHNHCMSLEPSEEGGTGHRNNCKQNKNCFSSNTGSGIAVDDLVNRIWSSRTYFVLSDRHATATILTILKCKLILYTNASFHFFKIMSAVTLKNRAGLFKARLG